MMPKVHLRPRDAQQPSIMQCNMSSRSFIQRNSAFESETSIAV